MKLSILVIIAAVLIVTPAFCHEDDIVPETSALHAKSDDIEPDTLVLADSLDADLLEVEGRRRRKGGIGKAIKKTAKKAVKVVKQADPAELAKKAFNDAKSGAEKMVDNMLKGINKMTSPDNALMGKILNAAKKTGSIATAIGSAVFGSEEEREFYIQEMIQMKEQADCFNGKIPNIAKIKFDITKISNPVSIPNTNIKFCMPSWLNKAKNFFSLANLKKYGKTVLKAYGKSVSWLDATFDAKEQMFLGPKCDEASFGVQFTVSLSAGASKGVGMGVAGEVGFQIGCMGSLPNSLRGAQGSKRWVLVPLWGFAGAVSAGYAGPGAGIDGNVYVYDPFTYYKAFGHELSIGADVRGNSKPGHGGAADVIFGCCTSPLSNGGVPIDIVTQTKDFGFGLKLKYPKSPYVKIKPTGGHVAIQVVSTPMEEEEQVRLIQPSTGKEIKVQKNEDGDYEAAEAAPWGAVSLLQDDAEAAMQKVEVTINLAYARACRRWSNVNSLCFGSFNP